MTKLRVNDDITAICDGFVAIVNHGPYDWRCNGAGCGAVVASISDAELHLARHARER